MPITKILITGGSGRVGEYVVRELMESYRIRVFDQKEPDNKKAEFVKGDITNLREMEEATKNIDAVIHLAAIPLPSSSEPEKVMNVNIMGTFNALEAVARSKVKRFIFASSDSVLGLIFAKHNFSPDYFPVDEKHPLRPQDSYGLSKLIGEEMRRAYAKRYGIESICLRYCFVWFPETYRRYSEIVKETSLNAKRLWGYTDVRDVVQAVNFRI